MATVDERTIVALVEVDVGGIVGDELSIIQVQQVDVRICYVLFW